MRTLLLTPGPLTTADATRAAMNRDWGSRDADFVQLSEDLRARLAALAGGAGTHAAVPIQGAGTYAVEAAIGTLVPRAGKLLVLCNGAYGTRAAAIARRIGREVATLDWAENEAVDPARVAAALTADGAITDVLLVHLETTSGLLNPLGPVAEAVRRAGRRLLLDAMSSFGAVPLDLRETPCCAVMASANKGLEGVPGLSYVIADTAHLAACAENSPGVALDLHAQWRGFEGNGQWRFTPPVQVVAALSAALDALEREGGIAARHARYRANMDILVTGMRGLGFAPFLPDTLQGPVILTLRDPGPPFEFERMYAALHAEGVVLYPGKLTREPSFRIGAIGDLRPADMHRAVDAGRRYLQLHGQAVAAAD